MAKISAPRAPDMKYSTKILGWGPDALSFIEYPDCNFVVIFNDNAPEELQEIAIIHETAPLLADPVVGDTMIICGKVFEITAIGFEALHTLRTLGHCTLNFKAGSEPEMPGCIMLHGEHISVADFKVGAKIEIY